MKLEFASHKAMLFACKNFHYSKTMPVNSFGFSVFNCKNEWCGCILYAVGASPNISNISNSKNKIIELVRMALNGKQESTSKALSISLRLVKKNMPFLDAIVSYADANQGHFGVIYQATNWVYVGEFANVIGIELNGKIVHPRTLNSKYNTSSIEWLKKNIDKNARRVTGKSKYKYYYIFNKEILKKLKVLPYPKNAAFDSPSPGTQSEKGGATPTTPLQ